MSRDQPLSNYQYFKVNQVHPLAPHADRSVRGYVLKTWLSSPVLDSGDASRDNVDKAGFHGNIKWCVEMAASEIPIESRIPPEFNTYAEKKGVFSLLQV